MRYASSILLLLTAAISAYALDPSYKRYINPSFGFSVDIPADGFRAEGESTSRDGQAFFGPRGAEVRAWGQWLREPKALPCAPASALPSARARITSTRASGRTATIATGHDGDDLFYIKTIKRADRCLYVRFIYPAQDADALGVVVGHVGMSFVD